MKEPQLAFPVIGTITGKLNALGQPQMMGIYQSGMTLRDYFAAQAIQGCIIHAPTIQDMSALANDAYMMADFMLSAGRLPEPQGKEVTLGK